MKFKYVVSLFLLLITTGCSNNTDSSSSSLSSLMNNISSNDDVINYDDYSKYSITLNNMYSMNDEVYGVYFYSSTCPACYDLKNYLFNFLDLDDKCLNVYLINLFNETEEDFNKLNKTYGLTDEEIINNSIGASTLEETYFKMTPCLYIIEKENDINYLKDIYLSYSEVFNLFTNNKLK